MIDFNWIKGVNDYEYINFLENKLKKQELFIKKSFEIIDNINTHLINAEKIVDTLS